MREYCVFFIVAILSATGCGKSIAGNYTLVDGGCMENLSLKSLGNGQYNIVLHEERDYRIDVLGELKGDEISANFGHSMMNFKLENSRVVLSYKDNRCVYEKAE